MQGDESKCKFREVAVEARFSRAKLRMVIPLTEGGDVTVSLNHPGGKFEVAHFDQEDIKYWVTTACLALKVEGFPGSPE